MPTQIQFQIPLNILQSRDIANDLKGEYVAKAMAIAIGEKPDSKGNITMLLEGYKALNKEFRSKQLPPAKRKPIAPTLPNFKTATWDELHTHIWTNDPVKDAIYILDFNYRIRVEGCQTTRACKYNFSIRVITNPPPLGKGQEAMFEWGVNQHNFVNEELFPIEMTNFGKTNKRKWTIAEAKLKWLLN